MHLFNQINKPEKDNLTQSREKNQQHANEAACQTGDTGLFLFLFESLCVWRDKIPFPG